jgi:hypothetical protein
MTMTFFCIQSANRSEFLASIATDGEMREYWLASARRWRALAHEVCP